ncbi:MAG: class I SAM-dependent methyltransferase, partial [Myxococcales bacterium]|nr:class I SAM-dependent methyltransferase [Myxococcales bacterium]
SLALSLALPLARTGSAPVSAHGNKQKHESRNPVQRALIAHFKRHALRLTRRTGPRSILDVGCGEGYMLAAIADAGVDAELAGLDLSAPAIADARARLGDRARLEVRDARELADLGEQFDMVMMLEVLEHLPDPATMLPLLGRLARSHVLLSVPWEPFFRGLNLLRGKNISALGNDPEHIQHWGRRSFVRFVERRFRPLEAPAVFPWVMVLAANDRPRA